MELTSDLAQAWIKYCLIVVDHAKSQGALDYLADIVHADIRMMYNTHLIDEDERAWTVQTVNDAIKARTDTLLQALKEPPKHEH
jgi:hypothetical protein